MTKLCVFNLDTDDSIETKKRIMREWLNLQDVQLKKFLFVFKNKGEEADKIRRDFAIENQMDINNITIVDSVNSKNWIANYQNSNPEMR